MDQPEGFTVAGGELGPVSGATLTRCPQCGSTQLTVTAQWHCADVICQACHSAWRLQHGWLIRLPSGTVDGATPANAPSGLAT
jgi:hypothetical protein